MAEQEPNARTAGPPPEGSLRGSTLGGMIWTFSGAGFQAILRLVLVLVLARMLGPEVFGIVGAALVVIHISLVFSNLGISAALVQRPVLGPGHVQTAFGFALASGALVSFALQLLTPTIVAFFEFVGGPGSGRWIGHDKRTTVEECLVLSIAPLFSQRLVVPGAWTSGSLSWKRTGEAEPFATIGFEAGVVGPAHAWMRLRYTANGDPVDYRVRLTTTQPNFGGLRWWFVCPILRADRGPPRRVAKLYLPPGQIYFGSREAHRLTYTSCQESHDRLFRRIAAELGTNEATVRRALKGRRALQGRVSRAQSPEI